MDLFKTTGHSCRQTITERALAGDLVLLKSQVPREECILFREQMLGWQESEPAEDHELSYYSRTKLNYHILVQQYKDKEHEGDWIDYEEGVTKIDVHNYRVGDYKDPAFIKKVPVFENIGKNLLPLYKEVLPNKNIHHGCRNGQNLYFEVAQYKEGGFIDTHTHLRHIEFGQDFNMLTMFSNPGEDFEGGQLYFENGSGRIDLTSDFKMGDVLFFRMDLRHGVTPVRLGSDENAMGRWSMSAFYY